MQKPNSSQQLNPGIWVVALILTAVLASIGFMVDKRIQRNIFYRVAAEIKSDINQTLLTASADVYSVQVAEFDPQIYLFDLAKGSSISTLATDYYLINPDGTYYAENTGNPNQNYLATEDDTDHGSTPLSVVHTELWRYHFLHAEAASPNLWLSPFHQDHWVISVGTNLPHANTRNVVAIEINPLNLNSVKITDSINFQFQSSIQNTTGTQDQAAKYPFIYALTARLWVHGNLAFPWLALISPIVGLSLFFSYLWSSHKRIQPRVTSQWKDLQPTLCDELNITLFETNSASEVIWMVGQLPEGTLLSNLGIGQSITSRLDNQTNYLSYWQHSLAGEKLTFEIDNSSHCIRIHQWPVKNRHHEVTGIRVMIHDISEKRSLEQQLQHQHLHDSLTGLPNRQVFIEQLEHELHRAKRRQELLAVIAIEVSGIGHINKQHGHRVSDLLLQKISQNLLKVLRNEDTLCRFSNDEFLVCFYDYRQPDVLQLLAERIINKASAKIEIEGHLLNLFANVGIATYPRDAADTGSLISNAITAMRHARQSGRNSLDYFSEDNARAAHEKWQLEQDMTRALSAQDFTLHYQPIFDLKTNRCVGAEALIRWPGTGLAPDQFIPLAEETGLIRNIGFWVIETAINQFNSWNLQSQQIDYISINLSVLQLQDDDFFNQLDKIIQRSPFEMGRVVLELTESVMMNTNTGMLQKLKALRDRGFYLAIDDFGTGFSSLNYLKHLPINYLKVDRSFVSGIPDNQHDTVICEAIIQMAIAMDLQIIAEGVETPGQMAWLSSKGVMFAQGYFYAHAVSASDFNTYIGIR